MSTDPPGAKFTPLRHFDYEVLDAHCTCVICEDFRAKHAAYETAHAAVEGHQRSCMCDGCKAMRKAHTAERAADERRTLYCEMSWLSSRDPDLGAGAMTWIDGKIHDPAKGDGWWEGRAPYYSLGWWINGYLAFTQTMASGVSGVFSMAVSGA